MTVDEITDLLVEELYFGNSIMSATGSVRTVLRLEGFCVLVVSTIAYAQCGFGWGLFTLFFLTPDIALLGYMAGRRRGAAAYNLTHSFIGAFLCLVAGWGLALPALLSAGFIWCAHIGLDRALGYGLKYSEGFGITHLGRIGKTTPKA